MHTNGTMPKTCNRCGIEKTRADFYRNAGMPDGLLKQCIDCTRKAKREHYPQIKDAQNAAQRKRYAEDPKHRQRQNNRARQWKIDNREHWQDTLHQYYLDHKEDHQARNRREYESRSAWMRRQKDGRSCIRCGIGDTRVLQWHHRDPATKLFNISEANTANSLRQEEILAEIDKCDTICANCHAIMHWEEREAKKAGRIKQTALPI